MSVAASDTQVKQAMGEMRYQCPSWARVPRDCGHVQWVQAPCSDPTCISCERIRAERLRARWLPVLLEMSEPRLLTLTIVSSFDLRERERVERESFRRLLDTRLGPVSWRRYRGETEDFLKERYGGKPELALKRSRQLRALDVFDKRLAEYADERWLSFSRLALAAGSLLLFLPEHECLVMGLVAVLNVLAKEVRAGIWPRVRDIIGPGMSSREVTWGGIFGWHLHRHVCYDGWFIPWSLLVVVWRNATKGEGEVVGISALRKDYKSMLEVVKYPAKSWEVPNERVGELIEALRGKKRVWPLGNAKPVELDHTCPDCHCPECKAGAVRLGRTMRNVKHDEREVAVVLMHGFGDEDDWYVYLERVDGSWRELDEYDALKFIALAFACQQQACEELSVASKARDGPKEPSSEFNESLLEVAFGDTGSNWSNN